MLPQHLTVSAIHLLHALTMASPQILKKVEYEGVFSSHSAHLTLQVMLYMQSQGFTTQTTPKGESQHASPWKGLLPTLLPPSPVEGTGRLTRKALESTGIKYVKQLIFSWTLDLFQASHRNVGRNTRLSVEFCSRSGILRHCVKFSYLERLHRV